MALSAKGTRMTSGQVGAYNGNVGFLSIEDNQDLEHEMNENGTERNNDPNSTINHDDIHQASGQPKAFTHLNQAAGSSLQYKVLELKFHEGKN
jgi:hypothetical protein